MSIFSESAPKIIFDLRHELKISHLDACAIVGNAGHESGGFLHMRQIGGGDGLGICQWSGKRRSQYEFFCRLKNLHVDTIGAGVRFLINELRTDYAFVLCHMASMTSLYGKTVAFERYFEAAGVPALEMRFVYAMEAEKLPLSDSGFIDVAKSED